jgi:hypothetical protein
MSGVFVARLPISDTMGWLCWYYLWGWWPLSEPISNPGVVTSEADLTETDRNRLMLWAHCKGPDLDRFNLFHGSIQAEHE